MTILFCWFAPAAPRQAKAKKLREFFRQADKLLLPTARPLAIIICLDSRQVPDQRFFFLIAVAAGRMKASIPSPMADLHPLPPVSTLVVAASGWSRRSLCGFRRNCCTGRFCSFRCFSGIGRLVVAGSRELSPRIGVGQPFDFGYCLLIIESHKVEPEELAGVKVSPL